MSANETAQQPIGLQPERLESNEGRRGLLDLSVELSTEDVVAGAEFSVYVLVKNPYSSSVWIRGVTVNVPNEIELPQWLEAEQKKQQKEVKEKEDTESQAREREQIVQKEAERRIRIQEIERQIEAVEAKMAIIVDRKKREEFWREARELKIQLEREKILGEFATLHSESGGVVATIKPGAEISLIETAPFSDAVLTIGQNAKVGEIRIGQKSGIGFGGKEIDLSGSLPSTSPLQPGDTAVYTVLLRTKSNLLFRPAQYKLYFNVSYHFGKESELRVNTTARTLSIRASIAAIMAGSLIGGFAGFTSRQLQLVGSPDAILKASSSLFLALLLSLILSAVAVVFTARKSDAQSFVSIEDFWGGLLIGFLVGYSGIAAFQNIAGLPSGSK